MSDSKLDLEEEILRSDLSLDRTALANERTLLSYARTALFLLVTGVSVVKLFAPNIGLEALGYFLSATSVAVMAVGVESFRRIRKKVRKIRNTTLGQAGPRHATEDDD